MSSIWKVSLNHIENACVNHCSERSAYRNDSYIYERIDFLASVLPIPLFFRVEENKFIFLNQSYLLTDIASTKQFLM